MLRNIEDVFKRTFWNKFIIIDFIIIILDFIQMANPCFTLCKCAQVSAFKGTSSAVPITTYIQNQTYINI